MRILDVCVRIHTSKHTAQFIDCLLCESFFQLGTCTFTQMQRTAGCARQSNHSDTVHACHNKLLRQRSFNFSLTIGSVMHGECRLLLSCKGCAMYSVWISSDSFTGSLKLNSWMSFHVMSSGTLDLSSCSQKINVLHMFPDHQAGW